MKMKQNCSRYIHLVHTRRSRFLYNCKKLNSLGIPSRQNKQWSIRSIKLLLSNPVYKGTVVWNRKIVQRKRAIQKEDEWVIQENAAPAIVTDELWNESQNGCKLLPLLHAPKQVPIFLEGY